MISSRINAKKYIEITGGKKTAEHDIAVVGDLIGDPYKDTVLSRNYTG